MRNNQVVKIGENIALNLQIKIGSGMSVEIHKLNIAFDGQTFSFDALTGAPIGPESSTIISVKPVNSGASSLTQIDKKLISSSENEQAALTNTKYGGVDTLRYEVTWSTARMGVGTHFIRVDAVSSQPIATYSS